MKINKKLLTLGITIASAIPAAVVVSCGTSKPPGPSLTGGYSSYVRGNNAQVDAVVDQFEKDHYTNASNQWANESVDQQIRYITRDIYSQWRRVVRPNKNLYSSTSTTIWHDSSYSSNYTPNLYFSPLKFVVKNNIPAVQYHVIDMSWLSWSVYDDKNTIFFFSERHKWLEGQFPELAKLSFSNAIGEDYARKMEEEFQSRGGYGDYGYDYSKSASYVLRNKFFEWIDSDGVITIPLSDLPKNYVWDNFIEERHRPIEGHPGYLTMPSSSIYHFNDGIHPKNADLLRDFKQAQSISDIPSGLYIG